MNYYSYVDDMGINEFLDIITSNYDLSSRLYSTMNIEKGYNVYNSCNFCKFETSKLGGTEEIEAEIIDTTDQIDMEITRHLYEKHYRECMNIINKYWLETIANKPGQQRLEVEI